MIMTIFSPAIKLMNQLAYSKKMSFLALIVISTISFLSYSLYLQLNKVIVDSKIELIGIEEIVKINHLIQLSQQYRGLSLAKNNKDQNFINLHRRKKTELESAYKVIFNDFDLSIPFLANKNYVNNSTYLTHLDSLWKKIELSNKNNVLLTPNNALLIHYNFITDFISELTVLNKVLSEHYLLMTDKDITSNYLIEILLEDIPEITENMGKIRATVLGILVNKKLPHEQRRKLTILEANLQHSINHFNHNLNKVMYYSPNMKDDLIDFYSQLSKEKRQLIDLLATDIYPEKFEMDANYFWLEITANIDSLYLLMCDPIIPSLNIYLNQRVQKSELTLTTQLSIATISLFFTLYFMIALTKALKINIHHISDVVNDYAKGNSKVRIKLNTRDEMRKISIAINKMAKKLTDSQRQLVFQQKILDEHCMVSICDAKGVITYVNDTFVIINQHTHSELIGSNHRVVKSDFHSPEFYKTMWDTLIKGNIWQGNIKNKAKDGSSYWVKSTIAPYMDETTGKPTQYIAIRTDISEIKAFEEKQLKINLLLEQEKKKADKANQAKSEFLSAMSHELRTPLNAILGFSQILDTDTINPLTEKQKTSMSYILSSGKHLLNLINDVLALSAIEAGHVEFSLEPLQLDSVTNSSLALLTPLADKAGIKIKVLSNLTLTVNADYTKLKQVIINLVSNAIKYNHKGGLITIKSEISANNWVKLKITDTGIGISEKNQNKLFNAFNRLGQENSSIEGTGIGLVVTKELIEKMNGHIGFESVENKGSTFWFELPIMTEILGNQAVYQKNNPINTSNLSTILENKKILYIEDNPTNRDFMIAFLKSKNYKNLVLAETMKLGYDSAMMDHFDLILMDINLPDGNGKDLTRKLRATEYYKNVPILAISAAAMKHDLDSAEGLFNAYITKPLLISDLSEALEKYLV
jgi:PAS domain S-box-containing protein